jgi:hypothetical protein
MRVGCGVLRRWIHVRRSFDFAPVPHAGSAIPHAIIAADSASRRANDPADVTKRACPSTGAPHFSVDGRGFILSASAECRLMQAVLRST